MQRLLLICATLALWLSTSTSTAFAAGVSERRALQPGIWWDDRHPGHGFELQHIHDQLFLLWYTYDEDGAPVWYAAQTTLRIDVPMHAQLLRHQWGDGSIRHTDVVGQISLRLANRESARVDWQLGTRTGSWTIQPFEVDGVLPEVNHSGLWFQDDRPGYGLSLMAQGQTLIAALFMYDADGQPTWRFGNATGSRSVPLDRFRGQCPGCTASVPVQVQGDPVQLQLTLGAHERELAFTLAGLEGPWPQQGATLAQLSPSFSERAADWQLARFESEAQLKQQLQTALEQRPAEFVDLGFPLQPQPLPFTRLRLPAADEQDGDLARTDGRYIYAVDRNQRGQLLPLLRVAEVHEQGLDVRSSVWLGSMEQQAVLHLASDKLVLLTHSLPQAASAAPAQWVDGYAWSRGITRISILDRSDPAAPRLLWNGQLQAHLLGSRLIDGQLYLVLRSAVDLPGVFRAPLSEAQHTHNGQLLDRTPLQQMLPQAWLGEADPVPLVDTRRVYLPPTGNASVRPELIIITRIDLDHPQQLETITIVGQAAAVHVGADQVYLASSRDEYQVLGRNDFTINGFSSTDIHQIALGDTGTDQSALRVVASGTVEGFLDRDPDRAPLRFAELHGHLHVVTVSPDMWGARGRNRLTVLQASATQPGLLATRAFLPNAARPQPLGKADQMLFSTRFLGERLYAVGDQASDPLYTVDLGDPADPRILSELQIAGFSEYLQPLANGLLLGLSTDSRADSDGVHWPQGLRLSVFDISAETPRELQQLRIGAHGTRSAALYDHRAFADLRVPGQHLLALPARVHGSSTAAPGAPAHQQQPHLYSGLLRLGLEGSTAQDARIVQLPSLVTLIPGDPNPDLDDAVRGGRPFLFEHGAAYVDAGRFYWISNAGAQSGPH